MAQKKWMIVEVPAKVWDVFLLEHDNEATIGAALDYDLHWITSYMDPDEKQEPQITGIYRTQQEAAKSLEELVKATAEDFVEQPNEFSTIVAEQGNQEEVTIYATQYIRQLKDFLQLLEKSGRFTNDTSQLDTIVSSIQDYIEGGLHACSR